jgi:hypothetical protein
MARLHGKLFTAALLLGTTACVDSPVAPRGASVPEGAPNAMVVINRMAPDSTSATFTVTPTGGVFSMGPHHVYFPARAICDPAKSTYGVTEWDKPCEPLSSSITIKAEVRVTNGVPWVYFTPNLRFVPSSYPTRWVWLYLESRQRLDPADMDRFKILWFSEVGAQAIDESLSDPTLVTHLWPDVGLVYRRIKHFSGYQVHDGRASMDVLGGDALTF